MRISGGCLCGAVRYEGEATPMFQMKCYCSDCRKTSGAGHTANIVVDKNSVAVTGATGRFASKADSGNEVTRVFCPRCGSQIYALNSGLPHAVAIRAATLDDPEIFAPQMTVYASRAPGWDRPAAAGPVFDQMPPSH